MAKRCPACGYQPIGPYTDNCPICAEPVRGVRDDDYGGGSGRRRSRGGASVVLWVLAGVGAVCLAFAGCCGLGLWCANLAVRDQQQALREMREQEEARRRANNVAVPAAQLLEEFQNDPDAADRKYKGKHLEVTGVVERAGKDGDEIPFVLLHSGDANARIKVECSFDDFDETGQIDEQAVERLRPGQTVTVRGWYRDRVGNLRLRQCVLTK